MSEEPCAVNSLCKQSWTHPLTSREEKKRREATNGLPVQPASPLWVHVAAERRRRRRQLQRHMCFLLHILLQVVAPQRVHYNNHGDVSLFKGTFHPLHLLQSSTHTLVCSEHLNHSVCELKVSCMNTRALQHNSVCSSLTLSTGTCSIW